jgi:hypothetical protein
MFPKSVHSRYVQQLLRENLLGKILPDCLRLERRNGPRETL